ncbi:AAA family ATPase [Williamsia sterculiae]|uniref:AAA domain-containing protein n=1 Tax=Williamsia sterculiae TaxID=1344003 RepID=A0A1N7E267_9NOCA|nr:ATP-binding protein [Williamsia sterculiae]SIR82045.1 AAA domain-containing protein [Williamsia sterculiae]
MRLHRLELDDFRGIGHREVVFADTGVTVVEGDNEVGKSSMVEALDLLLDLRSDSASRRVRAVAPAGRDVPTRVRAEISCGEHRFVYTKQFNKQNSTELDIITPVREQLTGRAAHERVQQIMAGAVDTALFRALRLMQSDDPTPVGLDESAALTTALDRAAGSSGSTTDDSGILDAARTEYERYHTAGRGKPTGELAAAEDALAAADAEVARVAAVLAEAARDADELRAVAERQQTERRSLELSRVDLAAVEQQWVEASALQVAFEKASAEVVVLDNRIELARRDARERTEIIDRVGQLRDEIITAREQLDTMVVTATESEQVREHTVAALADTRSRLIAAEQRDRARAALADVGRLGDELRALDNLVDRVRELRAEVAATDGELAVLTVDDEVVAAASAAAEALAVARARHDAVAGTIAVVRSGDMQVRVDGDEVVGGDPTRTLGADTVVTIGDHVEIRLRSGVDVEEVASRLADAQSAWDDLGARHGLGTVAEFEAAAARRRSVRREHDSAVIRLQATLAGRDEAGLGHSRELLEARIEAMRPQCVEPDGLEPSSDDVGVLREEVARQAAEQATAVADARHAADVVTTLTARLTSLRESAEQAAVALADARAVVSDAELDGLLTRLLGDRESAAQRCEATGARCAEVDVAGVEMHRDALLQAVEDNRGRLADLRDRESGLIARLELCRSEARFDSLEAAETVREHATATATAVRRRAAAAAELYSTLMRHRDAARARYVAPYTEQVEKLGRLVFGTDLQVEVTDDLQIRARTLHGRTVPYESLSGGAREQLGLICRLACAQLVDARDGVPVILDDALGNTDPRRLSSMGVTLGHAARDAQVIVLTCTPERYRTVAGAEVVSL